MLLAGLGLATLALTWMALSWSTFDAGAVAAVQLALLGTGLGLTVAPTTSSIVGRATPAGRGAAAGLVMVVRLLGLSVGLSALTAWGLHRFEQLRTRIELPSITDPGYEQALRAALGDLTARSVAETFGVAAVLVGLGFAANLLGRGTASVTSTEGADAVYEPEIVDQPSVEFGDGTVPAGALAALVDEVAALRRRTNQLVGVIGVLLAAGFALVGYLGLRTGNGGDETVARAELEAVRNDLARVEAGAALYASQITGFQEQLAELSPGLRSGVDEAVAALRAFAESTIAVDVAIDEVIPIDTEFVIERTVSVPIRTTIPIDQSFDTTIRIDTPFGSLPLDVTVPVEVDVPVDVTVDIPIDETIEIAEEFPVQLDVPIEIDVGETGLAELAEALAAGLESLQELLAGLEGG